MVRADGDIVHLTLDAMAFGGEAMGRAADGRMMFVSGGLPRETVAVRMTEEHAHYARGVLASLPGQPSPDRVMAPPCPYFGTWPERGEDPSAYCGGCQWQHIAYPAQLRYKADVLRDALRRQGGVADPPVQPALGMPDPWHYRNHVRVQLGPHGQGFIAADGTTIIPVRDCPICHPLVLELMAAIEVDLPVGAQADLRAGTHNGDQLVALTGVDEMADDLEFETDVDASVVLIRDDGRTEVAAGEPFLVEMLAGRPFMIPAQSFFQTNTDMAEVLVQHVRSLLPEAIGALVDVYSGVGTFAILLADQAEAVFAIESDPLAVAAAVDNAAGLDHVTLLEADAAEGLAYLERAPDVAILDPPRTGLDRPVVELLRDKVKDTILYVSCDAATLARDVRHLASGDWRLEGCWPIDMFPQTYHVESVSLFRRRRD
jgi:23S rRNA (uracil1939-C5)-methyltransferase